MKQREFEFTLPVGYRDASGGLHREAVLRKMTGHEELLMTDPHLTRNPGRLVTQLLANCVLRLGSLAQVTRETATELTSPDRDFLLVKLRSITFGKDLAAQYNCPGCGESMRHSHDLDALPYREAADGWSGEISVELEDGYDDRDETHTQMTFRLPIGRDEELTASMGQENISHARNAILTRCLQRFGNIPQERLQALGSKIFLDLTLGDRRRIDRAFAGEVPGLEVGETITCPQCREQFFARIDLANFLLPA